MALRNVDERKVVGIATLLPNPGDVLEGYVRDIVDGQFGKDFMFQLLDGTVKQIGLNQSIRYRVADNKIQTGIYTIVTRQPNEKKKGKEAFMFTVQQDDERTLSDTQFAAIPSADLTPSPRVDSKVAAAEKVKRQAEALAAQATGKR